MSENFTRLQEEINALKKDQPEEHKKLDELVHSIEAEKEMERQKGQAQLQSLEDMKAKWAEMF